MENLELAKKVHEAFGPCSVMYECVEVAEVAAKIKEMGLVPFLKIELEVESIHAERAEIPRAERKSFEASIKERLVAAGLCSEEELRHECPAPMTASEVHNGKWVEVERNCSGPLGHVPWCRNFVEPANRCEYCHCLPGSGWKNLEEHASYCRNYPGKKEV